jgi:hypothetical protein
MNAAYAADGDAVGLAHNGTANASTGSIAQSDLTLQTDENSTTAFTLAGDFAVDTITFEDSASVAAAIAVSGNLTVDEAITMPNQGTGATTYTFTVAEAKDFTLTGNSTVGTNGNLAFILAAGEVSLDGGSAQAIAMKIDSDSGDDGILTLTGAGKKTFSLAIGTTELATMTNAAVTEAEFNAAVDTKVITNLGTLQFDGALGVNTLTNSGTVALNAATTNVAAGDEAAIVMHTTGSILNLNAGGDVAQDVIITATTDGFGTINIFDETDDAAGGTTTLAAASLVGADGTSVGTLNVGKSDGTKAGNLVTVDAAAMFIDNVNITGGNHADEDSTFFFN